jgi:hypothetical protein
VRKNVHYTRIIYKKKKKTKTRKRMEMETGRGGWVKRVNMITWVSQYAICKNFCQQRKAR